METIEAGVYISHRDLQQDLPTDLDTGQLIFSTHIHRSNKITAFLRTLLNMVLISSHGRCSIEHTFYTSL